MNTKFSPLAFAVLVIASSLLFGCARTGSEKRTYADPVPIHHLAEVARFVASSKAPVLVVLDIDDTLLTTPREGSSHRKFFGSDRWFS